MDGGFLGWNHVATDGQFSAGACWTIGMSRVSWLDTITWLQVCTCSIAVAATRPPSRWGHSYRQPTTELENGSDPCEDVLAYIGFIGIGWSKPIQARIPRFLLWPYYVRFAGEKHFIGHGILSARILQDKASKWRWSFGLLAVSIFLT